MKSLVLAGAVAALLMSTAANATHKPGHSHTPKPPAASVPLPIVGAGLPAFAVGGLIYWLFRRRRNDDQ